MRNKFEFHSRISHKKYISKISNVHEWCQGATHHISDEVWVVEHKWKREWEGAYDSYIKIGIVAIIANSICANPASQSQLVNHHELCMLVHCYVCKRVFFFLINNRNGKMKGPSFSSNVCHLIFLLFGVACVQSIDTENFSKRKNNTSLKNTTGIRYVQLRTV